MGPSWLVKGTSPIKLKVLTSLLRDNPSEEGKCYLLDDFRFDFRIPFSGCRQPYWAPNLSSVTLSRIRQIWSVRRVGSWDLLFASCAEF